MALVGDLAGDGVSSVVAMGAVSFADANGTVAGAVHLVRFRPWDASVQQVVRITNGEGGIPDGTLQEKDLFGKSLALLGRPSAGNSSAEALLAVGASGMDLGGTDCGAVFILRLHRQTGRVVDHSFFGNGRGGIAGAALPTYGTFGSAIAWLGDTNLDGVAADLAIGGQGRDLLHIVHFDAAYASVTRLVTIGSGVGGLSAGSVLEQSQFGASIAWMADVTGDGIDAELLIGAPSSNFSGNPSTGAVHLLRIDPSSSTAVQSVRISNGEGGLPTGTLQPHAWLGTSATPLGDVDGDGVAREVAVAARNDAVNGKVAAGSAYLFWLTASMTVKSWVRLAAGVNGVPATIAGAYRFFGMPVLPVGQLPNGAGRPAAAALIGISRVDDFAFARLSTPVTRTTLGSGAIGGPPRLDAAGGQVLRVNMHQVPIGTAWSGQVLVGDTPCTSSSAMPALVTCQTPPAFQRSHSLEVQLPGMTWSVAEGVTYATTFVEAAKDWGAAPGTAPSERLGASVAWVGDLAGVGCDRNILLGAPGSSNGAGRLALASHACGGSALAAENVTWTDLGTAGAAVSDGDGLGSAVEWLQDLDRDGLAAEVAIGAPGALVHGAVFVAWFANGTSVAGSKTVVIADGRGGLPAGTLAASGSFGAALAALHGLAPVDGLQLAIAVGAPQAASQAGEAVLLWIDRATGRAERSLTLGSSLVSSIATGDAFGSALSWRPPSLTRSGWLFAGAPGAEAGKGAVTVLALGSDGLPTSIRVLASGRSGLSASLIPSGSAFGSTLAWLGDIDGDGLAEELAVGAFGNIAAVHVVWLNSSDGTVFSDAKFEAEKGGLPAGLPLARGVDVAMLGAWGADPATGHLALGTGSAGSDGGVVVMALHAWGRSQAPWGEAQPALYNVTPSANLPWDRPTRVTIRGQAMYGWDPFVADSRSAFPPLLQLSGPEPNQCLDLTVSEDGRELRCTMPASLRRQRTLALHVGTLTAPTTLSLSYQMAASLHTGVGTAAVPQQGGVSALFVGEGLLPSDSLSSSDLVAIGNDGGSVPVGTLLIGDRAVCDASLTVRSPDGRSIACSSVPPGSGGPHLVRLALPGGALSNSTATLSYQAAQVTSLSPSSVHQTRERNLTFEIEGLGFGAAPNDVSRVTVGGNECPAVAWNSSNSLTCIGVVAIFSTRDVVVFTGQVASIGGTRLLSFPDPPRVSAAAPAVVPTTGHVNVTLIGTDLVASAAFLRSVEVGRRPCLSWSAVGEQLHCLVPPGTGRGLAVHIETQGGLSTTSGSVLSYQPPAVTACSPEVAFSDATVAYDVAITGSGFGPAEPGMSRSASVGGKACSSLDYIDDGSLLCRGVSPPWVASSVQVTVDGQSTGELEGLISFQPRPTITSVTPSSAPTAGGIRVVLRGDGFGTGLAYILNVTIGNGHLCTDVDYASPQQISCVVPAGLGEGLNISVFIKNNGHSEPAALLSYNAPTVRFLAAREPVVFAGQGGVALVADVVDIGSSTEARPEIVIYFASAANPKKASWLVGPFSQFIVTADSDGQILQLECEGVDLSGFPREGGKLWPLISVGGRDATLAVGAFLDVVGRPVVDFVSPQSDIPTSGLGNETELPVQVLGSGFGTKDEHIVSIRVGGRPCPFFRLESSTKLWIAVPAGVGTRQAVDITTSGHLQSLPSEGGVLSYRASEITKLEPQYALTGTGTTSMVVTGRDFGNQATDLDGIVIGGRQCASVEWESSSVVRCLSIGRSVWNGGSVQVLVGGQPSLPNSFFQPIGPPAISVVTPAVIAPGSELLIIGENFGRELADVAGITVAGQACTGLSRRSDAALVCNAPPRPAGWANDQLAQVPVVVTSAAGKASAAVSIAYAGFGDLPRAAPGHLLAWRPVGQPLLFNVRWSYPADETASGADPVTGFQIELVPVADGAFPRRQVTATLADLKRSGNVAVTSPNGTRVLRYSDTCSSRLPLRLRIRALNDAGGGPWSAFGDSVPETCQASESPAAIALAAVGFVVVVLLVVGYLVLSALRAGTRQTGVGTAAVKIVFNHLQTVAIAASFNLQWPEAVVGLFSAMNKGSSFSFKALGIECMLPPRGSDRSAASSPFFVEAAVSLASPLALITASAAAWWIYVRCSRRAEAAFISSPRSAPRLSVAQRRNPLHTGRPGGESPANVAGVEAKGSGGSAPVASSGIMARLRQHVAVTSRDLGVELTLWDRLATSVVVILFLTHMSVTKTSLQLLTCTGVEPASEPSLPGVSTVPVAEGALQAIAATSGCPAGAMSRRLLHDLEVCCSDPVAQRFMFGLGLPGLVLYAIGIPVAGATVLLCSRKRLHEHHMAVTLGFLHAGFRPETYYWESVVMLRKVLVAVIAIVLEPMGPTMQTYCAVIVIFALTALHARLWPYKESLLNQLELASLVVAFVTFQCGLFLTDDRSSRPLAVVATVTIIGSNVAFAVFALGVAGRDRIGVAGRGWPGCSRSRPALAATAGPGESAGPLPGSSSKASP